MVDAQLPGYWREWLESFTVTNAALCKILCDVTPAQVVAAVGSEVALPGESTVRQRVLTGGQRILDGTIASTDGTNRSALIYTGRETTLYADMTTASTTGTNVVNRSAGSFITDGYKVGDSIMLFGCPTAGNNGLLAQVTAVAALTLTCNGTPFTNETMGAGFRVIRVSRRTQKPVPLNSGNADAVPAVALMGGSQDPSMPPQPDTGISLSAKGVLIVGMVAAVSALPARVDFSAQAALY
jgi:hypothetical protein